jgi:flagellar basal-body rod protein FlgG
MAGIVKAFAGGELKQTSQALDFAIRGDGFFEVTAADGSPAFTRGGSLVVDKEGYLATSEGYQLRPAIHVGSEASELSVSAAGIVTAKLAGQGSPSELGRIELARFADTSGLQAMGGNLYRPSAASGDAIYGAAGEGGMGTVAQGWLEGSNVSLVDEMVSLMVAQRAYESSVKVIQASDEMLAMSNNLRK